MLVMTDSYGDGWNGNELSMFGETYFIPSYDNGAYEGGNYQEVLFEIGDGFCSSYLGCTNELASNYDENAIQDDGSCTYDCSILLMHNMNQYQLMLTEGLINQKLVGKL